MTDLVREGVLADTGEKVGRSRIVIPHSHTTKGTGTGMNKSESLFEPLGRDEEVRTRVVHVDSGEPYDVYIGRKNKKRSLEESIWHNPLVEGKEGTREEVIQKFEQYLLGRADLMALLPHEIQGKVLGCYCAPKKQCHGDVLAKLADKA